mmetsp:Transcript_9234/g.17571  ORF Transcript_9234/g.17571 Transcript_9234/m.17571 type:complete len:95 (-) Transcript_9234:2939-3223(-)
MMKMMLMDIKRCDEYTVHSIHSDEFTLSLNTNHPNLDLTLRVGLKALDGKSILAKVNLSPVSAQQNLPEASLREWRLCWAAWPVEEVCRVSSPP